MYRKTRISFIKLRRSFPSSKSIRKQTTKIKKKKKSIYFSTHIFFHAQRHSPPRISCRQFGLPPYTAFSNHILRLHSKHPVSPPSARISPFAGNTVISRTSHKTHSSAIHNTNRPRVPIHGGQGRVSAPIYMYIYIYTRKRNKRRRPVARKVASGDRAQRRRRPFTGALCQRHVIKIEREERAVHGSEDGTKEKGVGKEWKGEVRELSMGRRLKGALPPFPFSSFLAGIRASPGRYALLPRAQPPLRGPNEF